MTWSDGPVEVLIGDVRARLAELPDDSVQCVVTSPPYWGLRDYGTATWEGGAPDCDHRRRNVRPDHSGRTITGRGAQASGVSSATPYKETCGICGARRVDSQLGLEPTPDEYVAKMVDVFREVRRILRKDGTLWMNLGDAYCSGTAGGRKPTTLAGPRVPSGWTNRSQAPRTAVQTGIKAKDLIGIPWLIAFALRADGWYLRSDIIWSKPNPMPESVLDRPTKAHEYLFLLTRSERYYYDAESIRTELRPKTFTTFGTRRHDPGDGSGLVKNFGRDVPARHPRLTDKQRGHSRRHEGFNDRWDAMSREEQQYAGANVRTVWEIATQAYPEAHFATFPEALVEPCIRAGSREGDLVLDPFAGSGTTLAVARRLGRRAIGIELQSNYLPLIQRRVRSAALPLVELIDEQLEITR